jgi:hypothetical protein
MCSYVQDCVEMYIQSHTYTLVMYTAYTDGLAIQCTAFGSTVWLYRQFTYLISEFQFEFDLKINLTQNCDFHARTFI